MEWRYEVGYPLVWGLIYKDFISRLVLMLVQVVGKCEVSIYMGTEGGEVFSYLNIHTEAMTMINEEDACT